MIPLAYRRTPRRGDAMSKYIEARRGVRRSFTAAFSSGALIGTLGGLIGLGGA